MKDLYYEENRLDTYRCDSQKIAKLSGILQITQDAGRRQMALDRPSYDELLNEGKAMMLNRLDLKIYDTLYFDQPLKVYSWPCTAVRATWPRVYAITRDEIPVVDIMSHWALVDIETRKVLKVDAIDSSNYSIGESREIFGNKFKIPKELKLKEAGKYNVSYTDLDYNGHMNNTYYADILCNHIPEIAEGTHRVESLRIHYSKEAPLGDVLTIMKNKSDDSHYVFKTIKTNGEVNITAEIGITKL